MKQGLTTPSSAVNRSVFFLSKFIICHVQGLCCIIAAVCSCFFFGLGRTCCFMDMPRELALANFKSIDT